MPQTATSDKLAPLLPGSLKRTPSSPSRIVKTAAVPALLPGSLKRTPSSPSRIAKIAAMPERHGSHSLERMGEALDAAVSFVQAFIHLVWAKRSVFGALLMRALRLLAFVIILLPGWIPGTLHYLFGVGVRHGVRYGPSARHKLDLYVPNPARCPPPAEGYPTVFFVCGGAWMIGYRMWAFLFGWGLQRNGVLCAAIDYRCASEAVENGGQPPSSATQRRPSETCLYHVTRRVDAPFPCVSRGPIPSATGTGPKPAFRKWLRMSSGRSAGCRRTRPRWAATCTDASPSSARARAPT